MFKTLSIKLKLMGLVGFVSILLISIGLTGQFGIRSSSNALSEVYNQRLLAISQLNEVRNNQMQIRINLLAARQEADAFEALAYLDQINKNIFAVDNLLNAYKSHKMFAEEQVLYDKFFAARMKLGKEGVLPMVDMLQREAHAEADQLRKQALDPAYTEASASIDALINYQIDKAKEEYERVTAMGRYIQLASSASIVIGLLLAVLTGFLITRSISLGVTNLADVAQRLSHGDLTARAKLDSLDELGQVATAFNKMAQDFTSIISKIRNATNEVTCAAETQSSNAEQIAAISQSQTDQAASVAGSVEELNELVRQIADKAGHMSGAAKGAHVLADQGQAVVNEAVQSIQEISRTVHASAELIASLGKRSDQIGAIVNVIKDIADQTNLPALNAAIEAARAGEQGRGFAVVADEVRKLAERTTNATAEISGMISAIQQETGHAVNTMQRGSEQVSDGVEKANQAGEVLRKINVSVGEVAEMIDQIASSTLVESEATNNITSRIEDIADMARQSSQRIGGTTQTCHSILDMSHTLQHEVARFKL